MPERPPRASSSRATSADATAGAVRSSGTLRNARPSASVATRRRSRRSDSPRRSCRVPRLASTSSMPGSSEASARVVRIVRSSASSARRAASVSSAMPNPGSRSASSGNSRSRLRQNASIVLIATSPRWSRRAAPAHGIDPAFVGDPVEPREDAIAHLGGGLASEGDRQDVARLDAGANQVDVAVDEHVRLARAGRGLEHDIQARVDRGRAIGGVGQRRRRGRRRRGVLKRQARRRRLRFRHSPCGRPWPRHTWCRGCAARDAAETLRG